MKPTVLSIATVAIVAVCFATVSNAADEEPKPCTATDLNAARNFTPTAAQLKTYVDATIEIYRAAQSDATIAAALTAAKQSGDYYCQIDESTSAISPAGAQKLFSQYPQIGKIYAGHKVAARELSLWSVIVVPLAMSVDPQFGAFAKEQLSPQQAAFAQQNVGELRRFLKAVPRSK